jgi:hypothetical protein
MARRRFWRPKLQLSYLGSASRISAKVESADLEAAFNEVKSAKK